MDPISIEVTGMEVIQSIQDSDNGVRLIKGKRTFVRVFVKPDSYPDDFFLTAKLTCSLNNDEQIDSLEPLQVRVDQRYNKPNRQLWSSSLNFEIPEHYWDSVGDDNSNSLHVSFTVLSFETDHHDVRPLTEKEDRSSQEFEFHPSPQLHCKIVGLRVHDKLTDETSEPSQRELDLIRDYVEAMYPVAARNVHWSQVSVAATPDFQPLSEAIDHSNANCEIVERQLSNVMCQLLALRNEDVLAGQDPRTLYLGVFPDPGGRYGGMSMNPPRYPAPHNIALCSVDISGELAAHELAHALGRRHPGVPDILHFGRPLGQFDDDENKKSRDSRGYISVETDPLSAIVGLDTRRIHSTPQVLNGRQYFDLMTYRTPQWISKHTYDALYDRLIETDRDEFVSKEPSWGVVARYDLPTRSGVIEYLLKSNYDTTHDDHPVANPNSYPVIQITRHATDANAESSKAFLPNSESSGLTQKFGVIYYTFPDTSQTNQAPITDAALTINNTVVSRHPDTDHSVPDVAAQDYIEDITASIQKSQNAIERLKASASNRLPPLIVSVPRNVNLRDAEQIYDLRSNDAPLLLDPGVRVTWSASTGESFFHYCWPRTDLRVTTTVQCQYQRNGNGKPVSPWHTLAVSNSRKNSIWIDPRFYGFDRFENYANHWSDEYADKRKLESALSLDERVDLGLIVRVFVTIGFERICVFHSNIDSPDQVPVDQEQRRGDRETRAVTSKLPLPVLLQVTEIWLKATELGAQNPEAENAPDLDADPEAAKRRRDPDVPLVLKVQELFATDV